MEENNNKRLLLAATICLVLLLARQALFPPPKRPKPPAPPVATATVTKASETVATATASSTTTVVSVTPELFEFKGEVSMEGRPVPFEIALTNVGGGIERALLPGYKERDADNRPTELPISLAQPTANLTEDAEAKLKQMGALTFLPGTTFQVPERIRFQVAEKSADKVLYRHTTPEGVQIEREYQFQKDAFTVEMAVTVRNLSRQRQSYGLALSNALEANEAMRRGGGFMANFIPPPDHLQGLCLADGKVTRDTVESLAKEPQELSENVRWVAVDRQYFVSALVSRESKAALKCRLEGKKNVARAELIVPNTVLEPGGEERHKFTAYVGVKKPSLLALANAELEGVVDYTILGLNLAPLCAFLLWILGLFQQWTGSWGVAILGLTVLVKVALFPLNQRQGKSMRAMSALKPEMDIIREKYGADRVRMSEEMMALYKRHNVSPFGGMGCVIVLLQMPIWFSLYRSLWVSVDLYQADFLWITDLTTRDPYWILPVALVVAMFAQQKMMPTAMDPAQAKIMLYTMPLMFGLMMMALPAGLCFYILVNTLLTILQQHFINRSIGPAKPTPSAQEATA